jgi:hypothetical protein
METMTEKIFKYELWPTDEQIIGMPGGAQLLHVAFQDNDLMLWAKVNPEAPIVGRTIYIYGIGHEIDPSKPARYVGTAFQKTFSDGLEAAFVWHVFDGGEE